VISSSRSDSVTRMAQSLHRRSGVYASSGEVLFQLVKRDGRREEYNPAKLARSIAHAGVAPYMLAGILDAVDPRPGMDTDSLRRRVESELELRQPRAAKRYATTRTLTARGSPQAGYGWACINPEDFTRLNLRPGDTVWLSHGGSAAPFSVQNLEDVERGHVWLNRREMAAMGLSDGTKPAASVVYQETSLFDPLGGEADPAPPAGLSRPNHYSPPRAVDPGVNHA